MIQYWVERNMIVQDGVARKVREGEDISLMPLFVVPPKTHEQSNNEIKQQLEALERSALRSALAVILEPDNATERRYLASKKAEIDKLRNKLVAPG